MQLSEMLRHHPTVVIALIRLVQFGGPVEIRLAFGGAGLTTRLY